MPNVVRRFWKFVGRLNIYVWSLLCFGAMCSTTLFFWIKLGIGIVATFTYCYESVEETVLTGQEQDRMILSLLFLTPIYSIGALWFSVWKSERE